jgi:hypothetical protein
VNLPSPAKAHIREVSTLKIHAPGRRLDLWPAQSRTMLMRITSLHFFLLLASAAAFPQQPASSLPEAPAPNSTNSNSQQPSPSHPNSPSASPQSPAAQQAPSGKASDTPVVQEGARPKYGQQPKRILGFMPNIRAVSVGEPVPKPTLREKFRLATANSFDYSGFISVALESAIPFTRASYPQLGEGLTAYAQYYWRDFLDRTSGQYFTNAIIPILTHEDTRYYTLGKGRWYKRLAYASTRVFITPNDHGNNTFNISEVVGKGMSAGLGNLYYPGSPSWSKTEQRWEERVYLDAAYAVFREFWPDINTRVLHRRSTPPQQQP